MDVKDVQNQVFLKRTEDTHMTLTTVIQEGRQTTRTENDGQWRR